MELTTPLVLGSFFSLIAITVIIAVFRHRLAKCEEEESERRRWFRQLWPSDTESDNGRHPSIVPNVC